MDPLVLLIVGAVGLVGCLILLGLGLNMLREDRKAKENAASNAAGSNGPASNAAAIKAAVSTSAAFTAAPTMAAALNASAASPDVATSPVPKPAGLGNPFAGVAARFTGGAARGSAHEVLRVLRDNLTGRLMVEAAGKRYSNLGEVADGDVRQALLTTLHDLDIFAGGATRVAAGEAAAPAAAEAATAMPSASRQALASRAARTATDPAPGAPAEIRPLPAPTMNPFKQMAVLREMAKNPPPPLRSITEQIDDVLQERIIGTPMIHRALHVRPGPRGDAVFEADGQSYLSVDELPDVEVRDVFRAAIKEWEKTR